MAGAEARAVWQRAANRYFVQEDAKRAPKLACCQTSSATTKQVDASPASAADDTDHAPTGSMPFSRNPPLYYGTPNTEWWLHLQPEYAYQKGLKREELNELESAVDKLSPSNGRKWPDSNELKLQTGVNAAGCDSEKASLDVREMEAYDRNSDGRVEIKETERTYKTLVMDSDSYAFVEKSDGFAPDAELTWVKGNRTVPWWRTCDKDELASLVFQRSYDHVENCDLPPPQKYVCRRRHRTNGDDKWTMASLESETRSRSSAVFPVSGKSGSDPETTRVILDLLAEEGQSQSPADMSSRYTTAMQSEFKETEAAKDQLLEALRHSQTRAREADEAAKRAYSEKEDLVKLLFKQASQLFAYKQWFLLLQLETACFHNDHSVSSLFCPSFLPWTSYKGRTSKKRLQKDLMSRRGKRVHLKNGIRTYAVAFALGLSLVGAGLLLGWTAGWLLPSF